jgi:hypothetical protein
VDLTPPILRGRHVVLEPIDERHAEDLFPFTQDPEVCRYLVWPPPTQLAQVVDAATGRAIGSID